MRVRRRAATWGSCPAVGASVTVSPAAMYLNHSRGFSDRSARIGNSRTPRRSSRLPYALIAVGCALVLFIAAVVGYVNRSVDVVLNGQETAVRVGSTLQNLIDDQELADTYDAGDLLAVDDSVLTRHGGEKLSVKVDGKRIKQGKWKSRELTGGEKVTVKDGRDTYEKHEVQATVIEPRLKVEGTGAIEYVKTWGIQGRSEVWVGEQSGKTQDRGEVVPATDCVVECASVAPKGNEKYVALTFDEGPSGATKQILQVLKEKGVTATFFLSAMRPRPRPPRPRRLSMPAARSAPTVTVTNRSRARTAMRCASRFRRAPRRSSPRPV